MGIAEIKPGNFRTASNTEKVAKLGGVGFSDVAAAVGGTGAATVGVFKGYQPGVMTQAAVSAISGTPASFGGASNAMPYGMSTASTPFGSGGYGYGGATFAGGYGGYSGSATIPGAPGAPGIGGAPSQDFQEKQYLFQQMNDANWQMLIAQVTVNEISRDYQARSNILKTKSDTEMNAVRNMRA